MSIAGHIVMKWLAVLSVLLLTYSFLSVLTILLQMKNTVFLFECFTYSIVFVSSLRFNDAHLQTRRRQSSVLGMYRSIPPSIFVWFIPFQVFLMFYYWQRAQCAWKPHISFHFVIIFLVTLICRPSDVNQLSELVPLLSSLPFVFYYVPFQVFLITLHWYTVIRVFCPRTGLSPQTQAPRLQFCPKAGLPLKT